MSKIPKKPEDVFPEMTVHLKQIFGEDLIAILLYGSGAADGYIPGKTDLDFLVIIAAEGMKRLDGLHDMIRRWRKRGIATPLIMTKPFLESALDVYPIEFLTIQTHHVLVYGEDILSPLSFGRTCMRLQLEREIKGKLLHLRQGYVEPEGRPRKFEELMSNSLVAILSLFTAIIYSKGKPLPSNRQQVIREACELAGIVGDVFDRSFAVKKGTVKYDKKEMVSLFARYLEEIEKLDRFIDQWEHDIN
ncbi:MAG: hypothetical protein GX147_04235 [Deltaproteobacteria bacterium]|nr:hypothetical protein [Deltaproteobacteria bacterium]